MIKAFVCTFGWLCVVKPMVGIVVVIDTTKAIVKLDEIVDIDCYVRKDYQKVISSLKRTRGVLSVKLFTVEPSVTRYPTIPSFFNLMKINVINLKLKFQIDPKNIIILSSNFVITRGYLYNDFMLWFKLNHFTLVTNKTLSVCKDRYWLSLTRSVGSISYHSLSNFWIGLDNKISPDLVTVDHLKNTVLNNLLVMGKRPIAIHLWTYFSSLNKHNPFTAKEMWSLLEKYGFDESFIPNQLVIETSNIISKSMTHQSLRLFTNTARVELFIASIPSMVRGLDKTRLITLVDYELLALIELKNTYPSIYTALDSYSGDSIVATIKRWRGTGYTARGLRVILAYLMSPWTDYDGCESTLLDYFKRIRPALVSYVDSKLKEKLT